MRINLGCGNDVKQGYFNVDKYPVYDGVVKMDLSVLPWSFDTNSAEEILMLDFLEHFPYNMTTTMLCEVFRVLKPGGFVDIQVPDFEHCAHAMMQKLDYMCNVCGNSSKKFSFNNDDWSTGISASAKSCDICGTSAYDVSLAAMHRLYGGQDRDGNWHFAAFTKDMLAKMMYDVGLRDMELLEKHHQMANWNFKTRGYKPHSEW